VPIEKYVKQSGRALTTGLLAASLTLQLYPAPKALAAPVKVVQPAPDGQETAMSAKQIQQTKKTGRLVIKAFENFVDDIARGQQPAEFQDAHPQIVTNTNLYSEWTKVAVCEEGGWVGSSGSAFPDSLGITSDNWYAYGGGSDVSPAAQIEVGQRLVDALGIDVPDQNGCQPGGW